MQKQTLFFTIMLVGMGYNIIGMEEGTFTNKQKGLCIFQPKSLLDTCVTEVGNKAKKEDTDKVKKKKMDYVTKVLQCFPNSKLEEFGLIYGRDNGGWNNPKVQKYKYPKEDASIGDIARWKLKREDSAKEISDMSLNGNKLAVLFLDGRVKIIKCRKDNLKKVNLCKQASLSLWDPKKEKNFCSSIEFTKDGKSIIVGIKDDNDAQKRIKLIYLNYDSKEKDLSFKGSRYLENSKTLKQNGFKISNNEEYLIFKSTDYKWCNVFYLNKSIGRFSISNNALFTDSLIFESINDIGTKIKAIESNNNGGADQIRFIVGQQGKGPWPSI